MFPALSLAGATLAARPLRRLGAVLAVLAGLGTLLLIDAHPASAALAHGQRVSFESQNFPGRYIRHRYWLGELTPLATELDLNDATFIVRPGLSGDPDSVSFESASIPNHYLRHHYFRIKLARPDGTQLFKEDATFRAHPLPNDEWRFESVKIGGHFIRHRNFELWLDRADGSAPFHWDSSWRRKSAANTPGLCPGADTPINPNTAPVAEAAITCLTNWERKKAVPARPALSVNATLQATARAHSQDMVRRRFSNHINPEGRNWCQRMAAAGYIGTACGENIAYAYPTATASGLMHQWMTSTKGHRETLLDPNYTEIGVGVAPGNPEGGPGSAGGTATQNFGRR
jgi:uncharacterized protein YkwD